MTIREQVLNNALALPAEDRAFLAGQLEQSLEHEGLASVEIGAAWTAEIERRIAAFERGEVSAADADEALARMRRFLAERRSPGSNS